MWIVKTKNIHTNNYSHTLLPNSVFNNKHEYHSHFFGFFTTLDFKAGPSAGRFFLFLALFQFWFLFLLGVFHFLFCPNISFLSRFFLWLRLLFSLRLSFLDGLLLRAGSCISTRRFQSLCLLRSQPLVGGWPKFIVRVWVIWQILTIRADCSIQAIVTSVNWCRSRSQL